jgi:hypothetical protein
MAMARSQKLPAMVTSVTSDGIGRVKPWDSFIEEAQTTSRTPASSRYVQDMSPPCSKGQAVLGILPEAGEVVLLQKI